jgi:hypothetical protein
MDDEVSQLLAMAGSLDMNLETAEDTQGESLGGTGGGLSTPQAMPVSSSGVVSNASRRAFADPTDSLPVGLFVYDAQAGVEGPCGGVIGGTPGRFCCAIRSACTVQTHQQKRFDATAGHAYIRCPRGTTAFSKPTLNLDEVALAVREELERGNEKGREQALHVWTTLFESLALNRDQAAAVQMEILAKCALKVSWGLATPGKRRERYMFEPMEGEDDEEEEDFEEVPARKMQRILEESIEDVDAKVMAMRGTLGSTPSSDLGLPSPQVWPCLTSLYGEVPKTQQLQKETVLINVRLEEVADLREANKKMSAEIEEVKKANESLRHMTEVVTKMCVKLTRNGSASVTQGANQGPDPVMQKEVTALKADVNLLQRVLDETRARADGQGVSIGGKVYHSPLALTTWVTQNRANELPMEVWSDCISMFEQLTLVSMTSAERTKMQTEHKKAGHKNVETGLLINSFGTGVPAVFQRGNANAGGMGAVTVAGSYEEWDTLDGMSGVADHIETNCELWESNINSAIASQGVQYGANDNTLAARTQATVMKTASRGFWTSLRGWIAKFYGKLMAKANKGPVAGQPPKDHEIMLTAMKQESWGLICQVLKDIFADFLKVRMVGNPAVNMEEGPRRTATVIYGLLKGQQFMKELLSSQIERHPCLSPSLNNFCIAQRASLADVQRVEAKANLSIQLHNALKAEVHSKKKA